MDKVKGEIKLIFKVLTKTIFVLEVTPFFRLTVERKLKRQDKRLKK